ncbi:MAG: TadE/TadG family type IV pilus assembly protein [Caulobacteraceae bacterium]
MAVEFALVSPIFLLLVYGILEFGRALWVHNALQQTAIAGARCEGIEEGSIGSTAACNSQSVTTYIQGVGSGWGITIPAANITLNTNATCAGASNFSEVTLSYTYQTVVPQLLGSLAGGIPMSADACFPNQP